MAIVVPDGLLQNSSNAPVRHWIRSQAQISAVVSIPQEAFVPYGTGIKTSLLLLQKLPADDSACFLARIERMGYDVKGQPVYRRDAWGRILRNSDGSAQVDDDLAEIIAAYRAFAGSEALPETDRIFTVPRSEMPSRFDVEHYLPEDRKLLAHLRAIGAKPLGEIADLLTESDNFRLAGDSDIRYIAISDVDFRTLQVVSQQTIKAHEAPSRATYRVCDRDIITAVSGASTGTARQATALITEEEEGAICSNGFAVLRNVHGVDPLFLLAYMRTSYFIRQVRRLMTGHAIPAITTEDLSRVLVPVPDDKEQERIARSIASIQAMRREAFRAGDRAVSDTEHLVYALAG